MILRWLHVDCKFQVSFPALVFRHTNTLSENKNLLYCAAKTSLPALTVNVELKWVTLDIKRYTMEVYCAAWKCIFTICWFCHTHTSLSVFFSIPRLEMLREKEQIQDLNSCSNALCFDICLCHLLLKNWCLIVQSICKMLIWLTWFIRLISAKPAPQHNLNYKHFRQVPGVVFSPLDEILHLEGKMGTNSHVGRVCRVDHARGKSCRAPQVLAGEWRQEEETRPKTGRSDQITLRDAGHWECRSLSSSVLSSPRPPLVCAWLEMKGHVVLQEEDSCWRSKKQKQPPVRHCICASHWFSPRLAPSIRISFSLFLSISPFIISPPSPTPLCSPCRCRVESVRALHWNEIHLRFFGDR